MINRPRESTTIPSWVLTELRQATPTGRWLAVMLYQHGTQLVDDQGEPRLYWRGSAQRLASLAGCSKRAVVDALAELADLGILARHRRTSPDAPQGLSVSAAVPNTNNANFAPRVTVKPAHHDAAGSIDPSLGGAVHNSIDHEKAAQILHRLRQIRVSSPPAFLAEHGAERIVRGLDWIDYLRTQRRPITNAPGLLFHLLTSPGALPEEPISTGPETDPYAVPAWARSFVVGTAEYEERARDPLSADRALPSFA